MNKVMLFANLPLQLRSWINETRVENLPGLLPVTSARKGLKLNFIYKQGGGSIKKEKTF